MVEPLRRPGYHVPNAEGAIIAGREQRLSVPREGQAGDILEVASHFGSRLSGHDISEADYPAEAALPPIAKVRPSGENARLVKLPLWLVN